MKVLLTLYSTYLCYQLGYESDGLSLMLRQKFLCCLVHQTLLTPLFLLLLLQDTALVSGVM